MRQFSTMCFQMLPQIAYLRGCGVTLVAFVLFSTVRFQMSLQVACIRGRIVTLVAFVCFLHCGFSNVFSNCLYEMKHETI